MESVNRIPSQLLIAFCDGNLKVFWFERIEKFCQLRQALHFLLRFHSFYSIRFELGLGHKFGGGFMVAAEIDLTLFANRMHFGFRFSLDDPVASIISAKDTGIYNYKEGVRQARTSVTSLDPYDPPNPFTDFDLSGNVIQHISLEDQQWLG